MLVRVLVVGPWFAPRLGLSVLRVCRDRALWSSGRLARWWLESPCLGLALGVGSLWSSASSGFEVGGLPSCVRDALFGVFGSPPPLPLGVRVRRGSGNCGHTGRPVANSHYQRLPVRIERCTSSLGMHAPYYGCVSASLVGRASMGGFSS